MFQITAPDLIHSAARKCGQHECQRQRKRCNQHEHDNSRRKFAEFGYSEIKERHSDRRNKRNPGDDLLHQFHGINFLVTIFDRGTRRTARSCWIKLSVIGTRYILDLRRYDCRRDIPTRSKLSLDKNTFICKLVTECIRKYSAQTRSFKYRFASLMKTIAHIFSGR